ncbi:hypothetical protein A2732_00930 [Candidatus Nomurabacteria bacterium RIFCSPHIGHO2_01_FULL_40_10]|nr:MAG: hypothetical protein A2732_00930 [Candidatus Nomurabacteria bacterium RIFCSPHIGHO2_01_FULL_40_10]
MVEIGLTTTLPDGAPPVSKFVPVQDEASEDHSRVAEPPVYIDVEPPPPPAPAPPGGPKLTEHAGALQA